MEKPHIFGGQPEHQNLLSEKLASEKFDFPLQYAEIPTPLRVTKIIKTLFDNFTSFTNEYGIQRPELLPLDRIHVIQREKMQPKDSTQYPSVACYDSVTNRIYLFNDYDFDSPEFTLAIAHEMIHTLQYISYSINNRQGDDASMRRFGIGIGTHDNELKEFVYYFHDINEAITDRLMERFLQHMGKHGVFNHEVQVGASDRFVSPAYVKEKEDLDRLINDLWSRNKKTFESADDVFKLFVSASTRGDLLPLARLIEKTYGKSWFRKIGEMSKLRDRERLDHHQK